MTVSLWSFQSPLRSFSAIMRRAECNLSSGPTLEAKGRLSYLGAMKTLGHPDFYALTLDPPGSLGLSSPGRDLSREQEASLG